jgi:hypothetical protein
MLLSLQVEETLSTLSYATRAKNIHNRPTVQYDPREAQISLLRREIELLRQENGLLREQLRAGGAAAGAQACFACSCPCSALQVAQNSFCMSILLIGKHCRSLQLMCVRAA